jgi:hypothetical protein
MPILASELAVRSITAGPIFAREASPLDRPAGKRVAQPQLELDVERPEVVLVVRHGRDRVADDMRAAS